MEIYIHPTLIMRPFRDMQRILDDIKRETGLVDSVTDKGAMLVYPEQQDESGLSMENATRLKQYQRRNALHKQGNQSNSLEIF